MKKILLLTASYGSGHNVATKSMASYYEWLWYSVEIVDIVDFLENIIGKATQSYYQDFCQKHPFSWKITYNILDNQIIKKILFWFRYPVFQNKFDDLMQEYQPDIVISFFPSWWGFIKKYIKNYGKSFRTGIVITDAISMHSIWYLDGNYIDTYFVIDEFSKEVFKKKFKHKKDNICVSFFPIEPQYFLDKKQIEVKKVYVLLSALEKDFALDLFRRLAKETYDITVLEWRNSLLYNKLQKIYHKHPRFHFFKFLNLKENYKHIDVLIGKAGGATISECIATDTPIIVPDMIPWQESGNVELLLKTHTGIYEIEPEKIVFYLKYLDWNKFLPNFQKLKNKHVCEDIYRKLR